MQVILEVKYVPGLWINFFSLTKAMQMGSTLSNDGLIITISRKGKTIKFDRIFKTKAGFVGGVEIHPLQPENHAHIVLENGRELHMGDLHGMMGHVGEDTLRRTAKHYGWKLRGSRLKCEHCGTGKAKQGHVSKEQVP